MKSRSQRLNFGTNRPSGSKSSAANDEIPAIDLPNWGHGEAA
jgi:hypothetical protein